MMILPGCQKLILHQDKFFLLSEEVSYVHMRDAVT